MRIAISSDHRGAQAAARLRDTLVQAGHQVTVMNPQAGDKACDYPDAAYPVALAVTQGQADFGVLICGTGIGMSIAANKVAGIRAALVHDEIGADLSRRHNDANVLCLSADMVGKRSMDRIVVKWVATPFEGGRHARRLAKIAAIEQGLDPGQVAGVEGDVLAGEVRP
jgi:ribose 5-phosphate isomerase B